LKDYTFFTDGWDVFSKVLPNNRHLIEKSGTVCIKQDNSNTKHHLIRMIQRAKVISKKESMFYDLIKILCALTTLEIFQQTKIYYYLSSGEGSLKL